MKDPAFLFYSQDFLTGVSDLTKEEIGQYIVLLCIHHQKGRLKLKQMIAVLGCEPSEEVLDKFEKDEEGLYFNRRLELEANKRKSYRQKQSERAKKRWAKDKPEESAITPIPPLLTRHMIPELRDQINATASATAMPVENENEDTSKKVSEEEEILTKIFEFFSKLCDGEYKAIGVNGRVTQYGSSLKRLLREGYTPKQVVDVIIHKHEQWADNPQMKGALTPRVLFDYRKFENYVDEVPKRIRERKKNAIPSTKKDISDLGFKGFK